MNNKLLSVCVGASLAVSLAWIAACGDPNPRTVIYLGGSGGVAAGSGGSPAGSGGSPAGSGGAAMVPGSGGKPATGSGGEAPGTGGAGAAGNSGAAGMTGTASGGAGMAAGGGPGVGGKGSGGAGGGPAMSGAGGTPVGVSIIDDFDDGDGRIAMMAGRQGPWHSFNDSSSGNQKPSVNGTFLPEMGGVNGSPYAAHTTGSGYQFGGIGFDLNNASMTPGAMESQAYDASTYKGIVFWAKGNGNLRVEFSQKGFVPTANGGSCTDGCWNVYGSRAAQGMLSTTEWKQIAIPFAGLTRDDNSTKPAFDPSQLMGIAFKHEGSTFDFWIDDVEFY